MRGAWYARTVAAQARSVSRDSGAEQRGLGALRGKGQNLADLIPRPAAKLGHRRAHQRLVFPHGCSRWRRTSERFVASGTCGSHASRGGGSNRHEFAEWIIVSNRGITPVVTVANVDRPKPFARFENTHPVNRQLATPKLYLTQSWEPALCALLESLGHGDGDTERPPK
jgi:hypothetical protein